jgi:hypothetical protein
MYLKSLAQNSENPLWGSSYLWLSLCLSVCLLVCVSVLKTSASIGRIFMRFDILSFFTKLSRKFKIHKNWTRLTCNFSEDVGTFMRVSRSIIREFRIRNCSHKICRRLKIHILYSIIFSEIVQLWNNVETCGTARQTTDDGMLRRKNVVQPGRPQMTLCCDAKMWYSQADHRWRYVATQKHEIHMPDS